MGKFILNGTTYTGNSADGFPPLIYSDDEHEVGVWRDGKPLYQKTINFGSLPDHAVKNVAHGIQNLDRIVNYSAITKHNSGTVYFPLPRAVDNSQYVLDIYFSNTDIIITTYVNRTAHSVYVTLQYTKTTDTAGSGYWSTNGDRAIHYSTTEQVIGTWIDGKPLYEKTVEIGYLPNTNTSIPYPHGISNIKRIISHSGSAINSSGVYLPLPKVSPSGLQYLVDIAVTTSDIVISTGMDRSSYYAYVTLQYTKTTD